jgi:DNA repair protein RadC
MENKSFTIKNIPEPERPRERLKNQGVDELSIQELLAIIVCSGIPGESVTVTVQRLLDKFTDIRGIAAASLEELCTVRGIGPAKACKIKAAFELANRWDKSVIKLEKQAIKTPEEAYSELKGKFRGKNKECFWAVFLNVRNQIIKSQEISIGSLDSSIVHPRELFKEAIASSSASMIVAHNHPSGNPEASQDDINLTKRLIEAGKIVGIEVVDHLIIGDGKFISMKREELI